MKDSKEYPKFNIEKIDDEPWITIPNHEDLKDWKHEDRIRYNQRNRQNEKSYFFQQVFDFLTDNRIEGDYFEFGCHRCRTFRMVLSEARKHNIDYMNFHAFDSFEGLPDRDEVDDSIDMWQKGVLATNEDEFLDLLKTHGLYLEKIKTIKGYYENSLNEQLKKEYLLKKQFASLITVDCDWYKSAIPVFDFIEELLIEGTVIYLDDMFAGYKGQRSKGVAKAFYEYEKSSKWSFEKYLDIGWFGRAYIVQKKI
tara:strand:+ start:15 stop:773 length:759 start_codon:yes stop_codon:yes gene_type:complete